MKAILFFSYFRDAMVIICSSIIVGSTGAVSFFQAFFSHIIAGESKSELAHDLFQQPLLVFYYTVVLLFIACSAVLLAWLTLRFLWELAVLRLGTAVEHARGSKECFVYGIRWMFIFVFLLLVAQIACFWIFWGPVLKESFARLNTWMEVLSIANSGPVDNPVEVPVATRVAIRALMLVLVFFLINCCMNIFLFLQPILNKLHLLGTNLQGEPNRVSLFRTVPIDLKRSRPSPSLSRQLGFAFAHDVFEMFSLSIWILFPIFVAIVWLKERTCLLTPLPSDPSSTMFPVSPLVRCADESHTGFIVAGVTVAIVVAILLLLNLLRLVEEFDIVRRRTIRCRMTHLVPYVILLGLLFIVAFAGAMICAMLFARPMLSASLSEKERIEMSFPAMVMLAGLIRVLFYLTRKLTMSIAVHVNPNVSYFLESACSLTSNTPFNQTDDADEEVELSYESLSGDTIYLY